MHPRKTFNKLSGISRTAEFCTDMTPSLSALLFDLNNTLLSVIEDSNAESALKALKDAFTAGIISEEEYSQKRSEIISKL